MPELVVSRLEFRCWVEVDGSEVEVVVTALATFGRMLPSAAGRGFFARCQSW